MNEMIDKLIVHAQKKIARRIPEDWCTDDWMWGNRCFQFVLVKGAGMNAKVTDPYRFCYREDEELYGTGIEQLDEWIDRWF